MTPQEEEMVNAYRCAFGTPYGQVVLNDLMQFCHFRIPLNTTDHDAILIAEGERRVFLRIIQMVTRMRPSTDQLRAMYAGGQLLNEEGGQ